ncbi:MAG: DNRLRE domain-containing protein [candidate division KSB1 bacterium]|nr:DNRLRE domain-containing protein [candidate division KSB1 bacterium]MDZ7311904.1 DNRLRE domain-containing protein [candidate division KSB1 bacterium]
MTVFSLFPKRCLTASFPAVLLILGLATPFFVSRAQHGGNRQSNDHVVRPVSASMVSFNIDMNHARVAASQLSKGDDRRAVTEKIVLNDPLDKNTLGERTGGRFVGGGGWQVTGLEDMIVYDLGRYIEAGTLEVEVRNFRPAEQNTFARHHLLSMFRNPWGNHHPVESQETVWDLHAGFYYDPGVKMLSWTYDENAELNTVVREDWDRAQTYKLKITWEGSRLEYFRDEILQASHTNTAGMQLRYLFLGRDLTVSADLLTGFRNNQYPAMVGPIYSNLLVKATISDDDLLPPQVTNIRIEDTYANGARLGWTTDEPSICHLEYGATDQYDQRTTVLGPPARTFSTALTNLAPDQTYHYRIIALDAAGNTMRTPDQIFTTRSGGTYLFKPVADTYVETAGLYGTTRDHANLGWMNLLAGAGRECYLRFEVAGVADEITEAVLRLHGRQSGFGGGTLRSLHANWDENEVTWLNKPGVTGEPLGDIKSVQSGQWHSVRFNSVIAGNGKYDFALIGSGVQTVSFDSRESTNYQPELIIFAQSVAPASPIAFTMRLYPNPFHEYTAFEVALPSPGQIALKIFDLQGHVVTTIIEGKYASGKHYFTWNGKSDAQRTLATGCYIAVLRYETEADPDSKEAAPVTFKRQKVVLLK